MDGIGEDGLITYFVSLMVVLRVVLEDFGALFVVECSDEVVNASLELFSPFLAVGKPGACSLVSQSLPKQRYCRVIDCLHLLCKVDVELSCAEKS